MPAKERRAQILEKAFDFFSENGLTAQTRALADACGVSQRLLYSVFPSKANLISAVYEAEIAGPFKAIWFVQLRDRQVPLEERSMAALTPLPTISSIACLTRTSTALSTRRSQILMVPTAQLTPTGTPASMELSWHCRRWGAVA